MITIHWCDLLSPPPVHGPGGGTRRLRNGGRTLWTAASSGRRGWIGWSSPLHFRRFSMKDIFPWDFPRDFFVRGWFILGDQMNSGGRKRDERDDFIWFLVFQQLNIRWKCGDFRRMFRSTHFFFWAASGFKKGDFSWASTGCHEKSSAERKPTGDAFFFFTPWESMGICIRDFWIYIYICVYIYIYLMGIWNTFFLLWRYHRKTFLKISWQPLTGFRGDFEVEVEEKRQLEMVRASSGSPKTVRNMVKNVTWNPCAELGRRECSGIADSHNLFDILLMMKSHSHNGHNDNLPFPFDYN